MYSLLTGIAGALLILCSAPSWAATTDEILSVYRQFAAAQNARDVDRVGEFFIDGPDFLWVSDGRSFWGREAVLRRMKSFQKAERWHVMPDLHAARVVSVGDDAAILHMPLVLEIGPDASPSALGFLVSIVFRRTGGEWRIAALLTTRENSGAR